ncbi:MAG: FGGY-family carbohydrate kinase, partial [Arthrobacter sp.]
AAGPLPDPAHTVRCILDSLATAYATTTRRATELSDATVDVVHVVGGGSRNHLLCQLTADLTGGPVVAGPVEATALGNVLVQARAAGAATGGLPHLREIVAAGTTLRRYEPLVSVHEGYVP